MTDPNIAHAAPIRTGREHADLASRPSGWRQARPGTKFVITTCRSALASASPSPSSPPSLPDKPMVGFPISIDPVAITCTGDCEPAVLASSVAANCTVPSCVSFAPHDSAAVSPIVPGSSGRS